MDDQSSREPFEGFAAAGRADSEIGIKFQMHLSTTIRTWGLFVVEFSGREQDAADILNTCLGSIVQWNGEIDRL